MGADKRLERLPYILDHLQSVRNVISAVREIRPHLIDWALAGRISETDFYRISSILTPQSRSPLWQNYFIRKHSCVKVTASSNQCDLEKNGKYYEYKASGFNEGDVLHVVQIRPWQECNYIVQSISDNGAITFLLTHDQMVEETRLLKATSAHGTKAVTEASDHVELRFTIALSSEHWMRWCRRYKTEYPF